MVVGELLGKLVRSPVVNGITAVKEIQAIQ